MALKAILGGLWLLPVVFAIRMLLVWNDLPESMASHFSGGEPDSYLPRAAILLIAVAAMVFGAAHVTFRARDRYGTAISAGVTTLLFVAFWQVVDFSLGTGGIAMLPAAGTGLAVAAVVVLLMRPRPEPRK